MLTDSLERSQALSCDRSFIIQAPAGSGKTELLTQRFLKLLSKVESPEQIVALTFTKKAAFEMRSRIIQALENNHQAHQWHLFENPQRLRIYTIDSFCSQLAKNLPITSGMGGMPDIEENPRYLYQKAVQQYLCSIEQEGESSEGLNLILQHFHNRYEVIEKLFIDMLTTRDQWLQLVMKGRRDPLKIKTVIQNSLLSIHEEFYVSLTRLLPDNLKNQWLNLASFAASQLILSTHDHSIIACLNIIDFPKNTYESLEIFAGLYDLIFTSTGTLRKRVDKNLGFPVEVPEMKKIFTEFIREIEKREDLVEQLSFLPILPAIKLEKSEWIILTALWDGLPVLVAHLQLVFKQYNKVDFTEVSLKALAALGEEDNPTDLTLVLDYQLRHLLVDEFQDTSFIQYQLFEKIVSGWQPDDNRTLFVVGDPMQSIYRFRGAEVGLYLKLQKQGFGYVLLNNIALSSNFRSNKSIIDWVNQSFDSIFSKENDMVLGKISYSPSYATQEYECEGVLSYQASSKSHEAKFIVSEIQRIKQIDPKANIAVLVRARHHAEDIFRELTYSGISYQAIDMLSLKDSQLITDLLMLTRVIMSTDDRVAWLSLLRSPVCGLTLVDLLSLDNLSPEGKIRANKLQTVITYWRENNYRLPLHQSIHHLWCSLGFDKIYPDQVNLRSFIELLKNWEEGNQFGDFNALEEKVKSLYQKSSSTMTDASIQIMTIHKAKGLEFDYVLVPGLHHTTIKEEKPLVIYHEIPYEHHVDWLIAPKYASNKNAKLYDYIHLQLQKKALYENQRLLYVAATRAKKQIIWVYVKEDEKDNPAKGSFLAMLAPFLTPIIVEEKSINLCSGTEKILKYSQKQVRAKLETSLPWHFVDLNLLKPIEISQDNPLNRPMVQGYEKLAIIGSYLHRIFANWEKVNISNSKKHKNNLIAMGLFETDGEFGENLINEIIKKCQQDSNFQWIMDPVHQNIHNEFALHYIRNNKLQKRIIDKFFIDNKTQSAWIIDFKLTLETPEPADHVTQLTEYARLIKSLGLFIDKPLRLGLYYPYQCYWYEQENQIA